MEDQRLHLGEAQIENSVIETANSRYVGALNHADFSVEKTPLLGDWQYRGNRG